MISKKVFYGCESRGEGNSPYLTRFTLLSVKGWNVNLHVFHRSDHDEPDVITVHA